MRRHENTWFKLVALVLTLVLLVTMLAACGGVTEEGVTPTPTPTPESTSTPTPLPTLTPTPAPPIAVTSPNGGENWVIGTTQTITWTSNGVTGLVRIDLSRDGGTTWRIITYSQNDYNQPWKVTGKTSAEVRIRVVSVTNRAVLDVSDADLSIA